MCEYMKIMVTGANGQLGKALCRYLKSMSFEVIETDSKNMDICDVDMVENMINYQKPDAIIHCAAYTNTDKAEIEPEKCYSINVLGTHNLVKICNARKIVLMYISTDYVFGIPGENFIEVDDPRVPVNVYGQTKMEAENLILENMSEYYIVRISWLFGHEGSNFVRTMLSLGVQNKTIPVVNDQIGSPTYVEDLVGLLSQMILSGRYGIYHVTNEGVCSWAEFAQTIFNYAGMDVYVRPITSAEFNSKAKRPTNSRLSKVSLDKAGFQRLRPWKEALNTYLTKERENLS